MRQDKKEESKNYENWKKGSFWCVVIVLSVWFIVIFDIFYFGEDFINNKYLLYLFISLFIFLSSLTFIVIRQATNARKMIRIYRNREALVSFFDEGKTEDNQDLRKAIIENSVKTITHRVDSNEEKTNINLKNLLDRSSDGN